jgi:hypothetical protein
VTLYADGVKVTIPEVVPWLRAYYSLPDPPGYRGAHGMGGVLHIVLEDDNTENHWGPILEKDALEMGDEFGAQLVRVLFSNMSRSQRHRLYRDHSFYA